VITKESTSCASATPMRILLFEDHSRLANSIVKGLAGRGFGVDAFATARDGLNAFKSIVYDAIVIDLGLPDRDGLDVVHDLRRGHSSAPILILTARDGIDDRVRGLDAGADDYVTKPFAMDELAARLRALLRRPGQALGGVLTVGNLKIQTLSRQVMVNGKSVHFSVREVEALELLMRREGQIVAKSSLEDSLYGLSKNVSPNSIEVLISRLRRRLNSIGADCSIHTLYGIGYLLKDDTP
jgi:DNA-binding response OmpR family regulator